MISSSLIYFFVVFVSHTTVLLGRGEGGTSSCLNLLSHERDVRLSLS